MQHGNAMFIVHAIFLINFLFTKRTLYMMKVQCLDYVFTVNLILYCRDREGLSMSQAE